MESILKDKEYIVYCHTSPNGKRYVGITSHKRPNDRWRSGKGYQNNFYFDNAINKYGWENFFHDILEKGLSESEAAEKEQYYIALWNTTDRRFGYNRDLGGLIHSEETKKKIGDAHRGDKNYWRTHKHSEEYCKAMSKSCKGKTGHPISDEVKEKIRQAQLGRKWSAETRTKILAKRAISNAKKREEKLARMTEEERAEYLRVKNPDANKNRVYCDGTLYSSVTDCAKALGVSVTTINPYLNGKRKMPKKWAERGLRYADIDKEYEVSRLKGECQKKKIIANGVQYNSQDECAKALGVSPQFLSNYLHGYKTGHALDNVIFE